LVHLPGFVPVPALTLLVLGFLAFQSFFSFLQRFVFICSWMVLFPGARTSDKIEAQYLHLGSQRWQAGQSIDAQRVLDVRNSLPMIGSSVMEIEFPRLLPPLGSDLLLRVHRDTAAARCDSPNLMSFVLGAE
jgi:hypothetical protein